MTRQEKLLAKILSGASDANISFSGVRQLLKVFGFDERVLRRSLYFHKRWDQGNYKLTTQALKG